MSVTEKDYLKVDPPIPGQNWVCLSFVSPDDMVEKKTLFTLNRFLCHSVNKNISDSALQMARDLNTLYKQQFDQQIDKLKCSVNDDDQRLAEKLNEVRKAVAVNESQFTGKCMRQFSIDQDELTDRYLMYQVENRAEIDHDFDVANDSQNSVRGVKIRGVFDHEKDARDRAAFLRESVEPGVHVYAAPVGYWLPWDPNPDGVQDQEHMIPQLNSLMKKYQDNIHERNQHYEARNRELQQNSQKNNSNSVRERLANRLMERRNAKLVEESNKASRLAETGEKKNKRRKNRHKKNTTDEN